MNMEPGKRTRVKFETMALGGRAKGTPVEASPGMCAVFTELAAPGDYAEVEVTRAVKRYVEADLVKLLQPGPDRIDPVCPDFGQCGGCNWQHLKYSRQIIEKADILKYILARNRIEVGNEISCSPSKLPFHYRSRADFSFCKKGSKVFGGFLQRRSHQLKDLDRCLLLAEPLGNAISRLKQALRPFITDLPEERAFMVRALQDPESGRIFVQPMKKDMLLRGFMGTYELVEEHLVPAEDAICKFEVDGMEMQFNPYCFTQVNLLTNEQLVQHAINALDIGPDDEILELYAGIGNFTLPIAKRARKVCAVESAKESVRFSNVNVKNAGLSNVEHMKADAEKGCRRLMRKGRQFKKVLVDPPRSGMGEAAVNAICALEPETIVSVSCHPDTLAKDLKGFAFRGYKVESISGYDMFPQTFHLETLTILKKK